MNKLILPFLAFFSIFQNSKASYKEISEIKENVQLTQDKKTFKALVNSTETLLCSYKICPKGKTKENIKEALNEHFIKISSILKSTTCPTLYHDIEEYLLLLVCRMASN